MIVSIYPPLLSDEVAEVYNEIQPKPADPSAKYNKICLCQECAEEYLLTLTVATYELLVKKKRMLLKNNSVRERINEVSLDQEITDVLLKICKALDCDFGDIMEVSTKQQNKESIDQMSKFTTLLTETRTKKENVKSGCS